MTARSRCQCSAGILVAIKSRSCSAYPCEMFGLAGADEAGVPPAELLGVPAAAAAPLLARKLLDDAP